MVTVMLAVGCTPRVVPSECVRNSDCDEPLVCRDGTCATECILDADCSLNARCVPVSATVSRCFIDAVEQCSPTEPCPFDGLSCVAQRCYAPCSAGCPADAVCVEGLCRRADGADAGTD